MSLGCSLEMCSADVVMSQLQRFTFAPPFTTDIMIETSTFTASSGGIAENNREASEGSLNLALPHHPVFSGTQSRSNFLVSGDHRLVFVHPDQVQQFLVCISTLLHWDNFVDTFRMYPCRSLHVCQPTRDLQADILRSHHPRILLHLSRIERIQKRFLVLWPAIFCSCTQSIVLLDLFSKNLQNHCNQFWADSRSTT